ncbi:hypothetical protein CAPTEDRAFT_224731 [Capitella teleta]|uniref:F5/8 type C domain-containing protein n=1 Tax=Capitella teleta TaxID=283909 RepID=R7VJD5_CAPTE|nr:hypothetical protein CAPTEDRAFT_224731 [Capitella teleta]|eukprot:ELU16466.1 hypothetical protein CAPTEDRAFT_224731 [Capitella teleta]
MGDPWYSLGPSILGKIGYEDGVGWSPSESTDSWIEVDLFTDKFIEGVVMWANAGSVDLNYQTTFNIRYRSDGSDTWVYYTDVNGNKKTFMGNQIESEVSINELQGGIVARYVRLYPLSSEGNLFIRWELLACSKYVQPFMDHLTGPQSKYFDGSTNSCLKTTDSVNNQIRMQWKGLITNYNVMNLAINGRSLICSHHFIKVGIEVNSVGCNAQYAMCKIEGSGVDGTCHAVCGLRDGQVGLPYNLLLMVTGDGAELCDVSMSQLPAGSIVISDWFTFLQGILAQ